MSGAKEKKKPAAEPERVVAYRLRDRDLADLYVIERCSRLALEGVREIICRMKEGEHPSTREEFKKDAKGYGAIERFLMEWEIDQKKFFEDKVYPARKGGKA
jgi:hypothetical protein